MKAMWKGSISFGLVNIPINLYPASEEHTLEFHLLHKKDLSPVRFARICKEEEKEIPYNEIVRGFEYEKGQYAIVTEQELQEADPKKASTIEIEHFTDHAEISPLFYEKPYFLEPDKKSSKSYLLLHAALSASKKVAIVHFVFRNREHMGIILPVDHLLILVQMRYHSELRSSQTLEIPQGTPSTKELKVALALIEELTEPFKPEAHHDTYVESLMKVIQQKIKGKKTKRKATKSVSITQMRDLMNLLQQSVQKAVSEKDKKKRVTDGSKKIHQRKKSKRLT